MKRVGSSHASIQKSDPHPWILSVVTILNWLTTTRIADEYYNPQCFCPYLSISPYAYVCIYTLMYVYKRVCILSMVDCRGHSLVFGSNSNQAELQFRKSNNNGLIYGPCILLLHGLVPGFGRMGGAASRVQGHHYRVIDSRQTSFYYCH